MYQIPWKKYSEEEIQEIVAYLFSCRGYEVYNLHKVDRRGEKGADLECSKTGETSKVLIAIKKKPRKKDIHQLEELARREAEVKIYIYVEEPSASFKRFMNRIKNVSFWDSRKLTREIFNVNTRFYLFLIIENYIKKSIYNIILSFCKIYVDIDRGEIEVKAPMKADIQMLNLLWNAKDRSASLHKSLRTLQEFFENIDLSNIDGETKKSIINGFLRSLFALHYNSLKPLELLLREFLNKYTNNFVQYCVQTKGGSNWRFFFNCMPQLLPGYIIDSFEKAKQKYVEIKAILKDEKNNFSVKNNLSETLGDISRVLANEAYWLEETVDDLLSIALFGKWNVMREKTPEWLEFWEYYQN